MALGEDVGGEVIWGGSSDSGRYKVVGTGSDECDIGTMPSGVDWREPLALKKGDGMDKGLWRADGMLIAAVLRVNEGCGEGMRGRRDLEESPLASSEA